MHSALKKFTPVLAAAAVVALAANGVSVAATGDGLIGGHHNRTTDSTMIKDSRPGPALRLVSEGTKQPSLSVSSPAQVRRLNASMVGGMAARDLSSKAITYTMGAAPDDTFTTSVYYYLNIKPGLYDVSMEAEVLPDTSSTGNPSYVICDVYSGADFTGYAGGTAVDVGLIVPEMSGSSVAQIPSGGAWFSCWVSSGDASFYQPAVVSFVKVNTQQTADPMAVAAKSAPRMPALRR